MPSRAASAGPRAGGHRDGRAAGGRRARHITVFPWHAAAPASGSRRGAAAGLGRLTHGSWRAGGSCPTTPSARGGAAWATPWVPLRGVSAAPVNVRSGAGPGYRRGTTPHPRPPRALGRAAPAHGGADARAGRGGATRRHPDRPRPLQDAAHATARRRARHGWCVHRRDQASGSRGWPAGRGDGGKRGWRRAAGGRGASTRVGRVTGVDRPARPVVCTAARTWRTGGTPQPTSGALGGGDRPRALARTR
jgi:hypothetical protein